jgi:hypothetical protein
MSAVNPASFSQNAVGQPPTGIGPGAVGSPNATEFDQSFTMQYGSDPDPYGAVPTYRVPDVYNASIPGPAGVPNDFAQPQLQPPQQTPAQDNTQQQVFGGAAPGQQYGDSHGQQYGIPPGGQQYGAHLPTGRYFMGYQLDDQFRGPPGSHPDPYRGGPYNNRPGEARNIDHASVWEDMYGPQQFGLGGAVGGVGMARQYRGMAHHRQFAARDAAEYAVRKAEERRQASRNAAAGGHDPTSNSFIGIITNTAGQPTYQNQQAAQQQYAQTHKNNGTPINAQQPPNQQNGSGSGSGASNGNGNEKGKASANGAAPPSNISILGFAPRGTPDNRYDRYDQVYVETPNFRFP